MCESSFNRIVCSQHLSAMSVHGSLFNGICMYPTRRSLLKPIGWFVHKLSELAPSEQVSSSTASSIMIPCPFDESVQIPQVADWNDDETIINHVHSYILSWSRNQGISIVMASLYINPDVNRSTLPQKSEVHYRSSCFLESTRRHQLSHIACVQRIWGV